MAAVMDKRDEEKMERMAAVMDKRDEEKMERVAFRAASLVNTNSQTELREKERQISEMRTEMTCHITEKKQKELENDDLRTLVEQKDGEIQTKENELHQMKMRLEDMTDIQDKEDEISKLKKQMTDLESKLKQLKIKIDKLNMLIENKDNEIKTKERELRKAKKDLKDNCAEESEKEKIHQNEMSNLTAEIDRVKSKHGQTTAIQNNTIYELKRKNRKLNEELENLSNRNR